MATHAPGGTRADRCFCSGGTSQGRPTCSVDMSPLSWARLSFPSLTLHNGLRILHCLYIHSFPIAEICFLFNFNAKKMKRGTAIGRKAQYTGEITCYRNNRVKENKMNVARGVGFSSEAENKNGSGSKFLRSLKNPR